MMANAISFMEVICSLHEVLRRSFHVPHTPRAAEDELISLTIELEEKLSNIARAAKDETINTDLNPPNYEGARAPTPKDGVSPAIVLITSSTAGFLPWLSFKQLIKGGGGAVGLAGLPATTAYDAFVVSIMFAFSSAFGAMFLGKKPLAARALRFSAIIWLSSASALLAYAFFFNPFS